MRTAEKKGDVSRFNFLRILRHSGLKLTQANEMKSETIGIETKLLDIPILY